MPSFFRLIILSFLCYFLSNNCPLLAQSETSLFQHLAKTQDTLPLLEIKTDWKQLIRTKRKEEYQLGELSFAMEEGIISRPIRLRSRGNVRKEVCYYPPIKIKLKKKALKKLGLDTLNDLKMVIQCNKTKLGQTYLLKEHLVYQLFEEIGPIHYETQLIRLKLTNSDGKTEDLMGFLIEDEEEFAKRNQGIVIENPKVSSKVMNRDAYLKMCFFQYLVLNTDWSITNKHNLEVFKPNDEPFYLPIPYDFDYCGLVDTHYAIPNENRPIKTVKEALFLGKKVSEAEAQQTVDFFLERKNELYKVLTQYPYLKDKEKLAFKQRMDDFYDLISNKKLVRRHFAN